MKKMRQLFKISLLLAIAGIGIAGCEKLYNPPAVSTNLGLLVVEGAINTGPDSTIIQLSRTVTVANKNTVNPETKAVVTIENAQGNSYALIEISKGLYATPALNLDNTKQYRLRIKTNSGKTYLSDLVDAKIAPPIDSVGFMVKDNGVQIYVNAHDATNNTHYYKYTYQETWKFNTKFYAAYYTDGVSLIPRTPTQNIKYCFSGDRSTTTIVNSTTALSQDVVYQFPVTFVEKGSEKIETRYSILLKQQALTKDAYIYWDNLKKNTDQLGSLFSTQPTQLTGNIHNIADATEAVIGYIGAGTVQSKRIYIDYTQLPPWATDDPYGCRADTAWNSASPKRPYGTLVSYLLLLPPRVFAIAPFTLNGETGYTYTTPPCADCTTRGYLQTPPFWK